MPAITTIVKAHTGHMNGSEPDAPLACAEDPAPLSINGLVADELGKEAYAEWSASAALESLEAAESPGIADMKIGFLPRNARDQLVVIPGGP